MSFIEIPEGGAPTADDMEILGMVLDSMKGALEYTGETTQKIRADFAKINVDLNEFGTTLKQMIANVTKNLSGPAERLTEMIAAGNEQIRQLSIKRDE